LKTGDIAMTTNSLFHAPSAKPKDRRLFTFLVILSFPIFLMVSLERRLASTFNKDITDSSKGIISDAKEYATSTIALAFQSQ
jgi:hypothetical protein